MNDRSIAHSPIARVIWIAAIAVCLFSVENVWIDPWIAQRSRHRLPSLVPDPLGGMWLLALLAVVLVSVLMVISLVLLLLRDRHVSRGKKALTAALVLGAVALGGEWFVATGGTTLFHQESVKPPRRQVGLRWYASPSKGVRYNVYRGRSPGMHPDKLNSEPLEGLAFTDSRSEEHTSEL